MMVRKDDLSLEGEALVTPSYLERRYRDERAHIDESETKRRKTALGTSSYDNMHCRIQVDLAKARLVADDAHRPNVLLICDEGSSVSHDSLFRFCGFEISRVKSLLSIENKVSAGSVFAFAFLVSLPEGMQYREFCTEFKRRCPQIPLVVFCEKDEIDIVAVERLADIVCSGPLVLGVIESILPRLWSLGSSLSARQRFEVRTRTPYFKKLRRQMQHWEFDVLQLSQAEIIDLIVVVFEDFSLLQRLKIPLEDMLLFVEQILASYMPNPFHNQYHAFDVFRSCLWLLTEGDAITGLTYADIFSLLLACLGHDAAHPGTTNAFQIRTESVLALMYNDISVLENYHASTVFQIMLKLGPRNILRNVDASTRQDIRKTIISLILSTDNARHREIMSLYGMSAKDCMADHRLHTMQFLLKCADVGNTAKSFGLCQIWTCRLQEEFYLQGDMERSLGLTVSRFMDRGCPEMEEMLLTFVDYLAFDLYATLKEFYPKASILFEQLVMNRSLVQERKE